MNVEKTPLAGVLVIKPRVFDDERGFFLETYQQERYQAAGLDAHFVQDNCSRSTRAVLRGLHSQPGKPQGKLVRVSAGSVWDVAIDPDPASATYKQWFGIELSDTNHVQLYIPPGYLHGFVTLSDTADLNYKCTDFYAPGAEAGVIWNDEELSIDWPISHPILSSADAANGSLADYRSAYFQPGSPVKKNPNP